MTATPHPRPTGNPPWATDEAGAALAVHSSAHRGTEKGVNARHRDATDVIQLAARVADADIESELAGILARPHTQHAGSAGPAVAS